MELPSLANRSLPSSCRERPSGVETENLAVLFAGILISAPVRGCLPVLARRSTHENEPRPGRTAFSPFWRDSLTASARAVRIFSACFRVMLPDSASFEIELQPSPWPPFFSS